MILNLRLSVENAKGHNDSDRNEQSNNDYPGQPVNSRDLPSALLQLVFAFRQPDSALPPVGSGLLQLMR
jgi:hypothetical protein